MHRFPIFRQEIILKDLRLNDRSNTTIKPSMVNFAQNSAVKILA
jgi:hypothetical protein